MEEIILISFCYGTVFCLCSYPLVKLTYNYFFPMSSKLNPEPPKEPPKELETDQESESLYPDSLIESSSSDSETEDTNDEDYVETNIYTRKLRKRKRKT